MLILIRWRGVFVLRYALDGSSSRSAIQSTTASSEQEPTVYQPHIIIGYGQEC